MTTKQWVAGALVAVLHVCAQAQDGWPARPVRVIVPASTGSGMDFMGRSVAQALTDKYRQQIIIDNRAGAGSLIGTHLVASATPDAYTLGIASTSSLVAPLLQTKQPYDPLNDLAPVALLSSLTSIMVVAPGVAAKNVQEFIALARARPNEFNFASIGAGSAAHLTPEIFNRAAGIQAVHVPFKTVADILAEMYASRVHYLLFISPSSLPMLRDGKLRAFAVTGSKRFSALPDVPTMSEAGVKGADVDTMIGVVGPAKLPRAMIQRIHGDLQDIMARADVKTAFDRQGGEPALGVSTADYARRWKAEYEVYRKLLPEIGLKPQ